MITSVLTSENRFVRNSGLKFTLVNFLIDEVFERYSVDDLGHFSRFDDIAKNISQLVEKATAEYYHTLLSEKNSITHSLIKFIFGFGVLEQFIDDVAVSEIVVKGTDAIYIRKYGKLRTARNLDGELVKFGSMDELHWILKKLLVGIGMEINENVSVINTTLPDEAQLNVILDDERTSITIRKLSI